MRLVITLVFTGILQAGAITGGSLFVGGYEATATLSGPDFSATISDYGVGPFQTGGFAPYTPLIPGYGNAATGSGSGVTYNGVYYDTPTYQGPFPGQPYVLNMWFNLALTSAPAVIMGP